jgi:glycosyltransferase involved in cell wall biosynthesis
MGKPRILVDAYYLHVAQTGIKTYMLAVCEEILRSENAACDYIISPDFRKIREESFFKGKTSKWKNLLFQLLYFWRKQVVLPLLSYRYRADVVFCPDIMVPLWGRGIKVSVLHDTFFWDNPEHYHPLWRKYYLFFLEKGLKRNGQIITVTDYSSARIQLLQGFGQIPVHRVYPASGLKKGQKIAVAKDQVDFPYILHVGVMEKRKNLSLLIEAFALLQEEPGFVEWKLILVGQRGPRKTLDDFDRLYDLVNRLGLKEKVLFAGYVSEEMLASYFSHAKIYVFPSINEGFGLPVLEAFSFGVPVIISNQGALKEVAGDAAWVLETDTPEALKDAMVHLDQNPEICNAMRQKGQKRLEEFGTEKFFLSLDQTFKKLLHG